MDNESNQGADSDIHNKESGGMFCEVPIEVMISVGKAHPLVGELLQLGNNSILALNQTVNDPVELYIGQKLIARGELQELEGDETGRLAVRLTEVAPPTERNRSGP